MLDQCRLGLRGRRGSISPEATGLVSNVREILEQFANMRCPGRHQHVHITGNNSEDAQIWPWRFAERIVQGIVNLRRRLRAKPAANTISGGDRPAGDTVTSGSAQQHDYDEQEAYPTAGTDNPAQHDDLQRSTAAARFSDQTNEECQAATQCDRLHRLGKSGALAL